MEIEKKGPSNFEKRRARDVKLAEAKKVRRAGARTKAGVNKKEYATRAEKYSSERRAAFRKQVDEIRKARVSNSFYVPAESKVALVVRIRGINCLSPTVRKILQLFRLR